MSLWSTASASEAVTMGCVLRGRGWMWCLQRGSQRGLAWEGAWACSVCGVGTAIWLCTCAQVGLRGYCFLKDGVDVAVAWPGYVGV